MSCMTECSGAQPGFQGTFQGVGLVGVRGRSPPPPGCRKIFENFQRFFLSAKMHYFSLFYTKLLKPRVNFSRVWTKNTNCWAVFEKILKFFEENSIEKDFLTIFGKVDAKNRAFGNNIIFLQQFFQFREGGRSRCSPLATPLNCIFKLKQIF